MKKILVLLTFLFFVTSSALFAQQALVSSGGDGTGTGGSFSYSFGQFAGETFFEGNSSVAQGVQHPFEVFSEGQTVPENLNLADTTIGEGSICYNALATLTIAGSEGPVVIQANATVEFIAGQSIQFLPGFYAQSGSSVIGRITTTGDFCEGYPAPGMLIAPPIAEKSITLKKSSEEINGAFTNMSVKVYPNPNNGRFAIGLVNFRNKARVYVYNQVGAVIHSTEIEHDKIAEIELSNVQNGLYYVRVVEGVQQFVNKIIVN